MSGVLAALAGQQSTGAATDGLLGQLTQGVPPRAKPGEPGTDASKWDKRADGSAKGNGWLGLLRRPDGSVSSELSVGLDIDGKQVELPTLVPGLSSDEVSSILAKDPADRNFWPSIAPEARRKIVDHAIGRLRDGKSPFATPEESPP